MKSVRQECRRRTAGNRRSCEKSMTRIKLCSCVSGSIALVLAIMRVCNGYRGKSILNGVNTTTIANLAEPPGCP